MRFMTLLQFVQTYLRDGEVFADKTGKRIDPMSVTDDPMRGTGRTTAGMLRAIASALENPDQWVPFTDHASNTAAFRGHNLHQIWRMVNHLGLHIEVKDQPQERVVHLRSPVTKLRREAAEREKCSCGHGCVKKNPIQVASNDEALSLMHSLHEDGYLVKSVKPYFDSTGQQQGFAVRILKLND